MGGLFGRQLGRKLGIERGEAPGLRPGLGEFPFVSLELFSRSPQPFRLRGLAAVPPQPNEEGAERSGNKGDDRRHVRGEDPGAAWSPAKSWIGEECRIPTNLRSL